MLQFEGQVALITGAASGIGKQIAIRFRLGAYRSSRISISKLPLPPRRLWKPGDIEHLPSPWMWRMKSR